MLIELKRWVKILRLKAQKKKVKLYGNAANDTVFEGQNVVNKGSWMEGYLGYGSYIGRDAIVRAKVGRYCCIADRVVVHTGTHPVHQFVSLHPAFYSTAKQNGRTYVNKQLFVEHIYADLEHKYGAIIGNDVWIGFGAHIMGGVNIGDGAVIAAGAIVTHDVEPYAIVAGVPAKKVDQRFSNEEIAYLQKVCWWTKSEDWICMHVDRFQDIRLFMNGNF